MINLHKLYIYIIELAAQKCTPNFDDDLRVKYNSRLDDISTMIVA